MSDNAPNTDRLGRIQQVISDCRRQLSDGAGFEEEEVISQHPDLMPELGTELEKLRMIEAARQAANAIAGREDVVTPAPSITQAYESPEGQAPSPPPSNEPHNSAADSAQIVSAQAPSTEPRQRIRYFGDYELQDELGRGGMGVVYKALQLSLGRTVAVKMILSGGLASEEDVRRFHAEAEAAANLEHACIVPIYEIGEHEDSHYFSMAFVQGQSLQEMIRDQPLSSRKAAEYVKAVADATAYAHDQGVLHRDIKPANVLIDENDQPRLTDFGLAKRVGSGDDLTVTGQILGTPQFMSPEQATGDQEAIGPRSDLYSLGALLYTLLTGRPPFQADNVAAMLPQVVNQDPVPPREFNSAIDRDLETITLKCLEKNPDRRYGNCRDLAAELTRYLSGEPINARPISRPAKAWRWCRRRPASAGLLATVGLLLLVLSVGGPLIAYMQTENARIEANLRSAADSARVSAETAKKKAENEAARATREKDRADTNSHRAQQEAERAREAQHVADRRLYANEMQQVAGLIFGPETVPQTANYDAENHFSRFPAAVDLLADWIPGPIGQDLRGIEWYLLWRTAHCEIPAFTGHWGGIVEAAFSPDGSLLATHGLDGTVILWNAKTGRRYRTFPGTLPINGFERRGVWIRNVTQFTLWDPETQTVLERFVRHNPRDPGGIDLAALSPDHTKVAGKAPTGRIEVWDLASGRLEWTFDGPKVALRDLSFSGDGQRLAAAGQDGTAHVWDLGTGETEVVIRDHKHVVHSARFSPDGGILATASWDWTVRLWDVSSWKERATLREHEGIVRKAVFSPDGSLLASGGEDGTIRLWDAATGALVAELGPHAEMIEGIAFSPDGRTLAACCYHNAPSGKEVTLWDVQTREVLAVEPPESPFREIQRAREYPLNNTYSRVSVSPDGCTAAVTEDTGSIELYDLTELQGKGTLQGHQSSINSLRFSQDGQMLVSAGNDQTIRLWSITDQREIACFRIDFPGGRSASCADAVFSPCGNRILAAQDSLCVVWDIESSTEMKKFRALGPPLSCLDVSPDGQFVACGSYGRALGVVDLETHSLITDLRGHQGRVRSVFFSPDGKRLVSLGGDGTVMLWSVNDFKLQHRFKGARAGLAGSCVTGDSTRIVTCSGADHALRINDLLTGDLTALLPHQFRVVDCAVSDDSSRLVLLLSHWKGYRWLRAYDMPDELQVYSDCAARCLQNWGGIDNFWTLVCCCWDTANRIEKRHPVLARILIEQGYAIHKLLQVQGRLTESQELCGDLLRDAVTRLSSVEPQNVVFDEIARSRIDSVLGISEDLGIRLLRIADNHGHREQTYGLLLRTKAMLQACPPEFSLNPDYKDCLHRTDTAIDDLERDMEAARRDQAASGMASTPRIIGIRAVGVHEVTGADLDADGDIDMLSASCLDDKIAWYENNGKGKFEAHVISTVAEHATSIVAADFDGDGDNDVLTSSAGDDTVGWYESDGNQRFTFREINTDVNVVRKVFAADVDDDGDMDALSASVKNNTVAWYENDGRGNFTTHAISTNAAGATSVVAVDLDNDGDMDVISSWCHKDTIAWYENDGRQGFTEHVITDEAEGAQAVFASDLNGDGIFDVLSASSRDNTIAWYEHDGRGGFLPHMITTTADGAYNVSAADIDGDGDNDVLSASYRDAKLAWYENDGRGNFVAHTISDNARNVRCVFAADVDGDRDLDVISAIAGEDTIAWYENLMGDHAPDVGNAEANTK